jgi:outer membrane protein TolC
MSCLNWVIGCQAIQFEFGWPGLESSEAPAGQRVIPNPVGEALLPRGQRDKSVPPRPGLPKTPAPATQPGKEELRQSHIVPVADAETETIKQAVTAATQVGRRVIPTPSADYTINLETALSLAGAGNPTIALAQESVRASLAEQLRARAALLPILDAGMNFNHHAGSLQSAQGVILDVDRQALYVGAGAAAVGAGTVAIPGVHLTGQLADALYAPRAARQNVAGRRFDAAAVQNAMLLEVVTRYFDLLGAEARLRDLHESQKQLSDLVRLTANFARTGAGREGDAERARSEAFLLQIEEQRVQEEAATASAELARLLDMDPSVRLHGPGEVPVIQLVDLHADMQQLIQTALANRPELAARSADVAVAQTRLRQEQARPLLPLVSVGFSAGEFGGGSNLTDARFGHFAGRTDFDVMAVWTLDSLSFGNLARQRRQRALVLEAVSERQQVIDRVRTEVVEGYATAAARWRQVEVDQRRVATSQEGVELEMLRVRNLARGAKEQVRQIEVLNSLTLLISARQDLIRALVAYDQAQFQLYVALGQPPSLNQEK